MRKKKVLFIANEIEKLLPKVDTTVFLIQQAWIEKYEVWFSTLEGLGINTSSKLVYYVNANNLIPGSNHNWFKKKKQTKVSLLSFSAIIVRTDPPFNQQYLVGMNILDFVTEKGVKVINSPESLRKFNEKLSLQLTPTLIHKNLTERIAEDNLQFVMAAGGRYKLTKRLSLNMEYGLMTSRPEELNYNNLLSIGFDIETGGHVFQLHFTNSRTMLEHSFLTEATGDWSKGDIHFGFNISRVFDW